MAYKTMEEIGTETLDGLRVGDQVYVVYLHEQRIRCEVVAVVHGGVGFIVSADEPEFPPKLLPVTCGFYRTWEDCSKGNRENFDQWIDDRLEEIEYLTSEVIRVKKLLA